jgi:uncharacterized membrane protein
MVNAVKVLVTLVCAYQILNQRIADLIGICFKNLSAPFDQVGMLGGISNQPTTKNLRKSMLAVSSVLASLLSNTKGLTRKAAIKAFYQECYTEAKSVKGSYPNKRSLVRQKYYTFIPQNVKNILKGLASQNANYAINKVIKIPDHQVMGGLDENTLVNFIRQQLQSVIPADVQQGMAEAAAMQVA